MLELGAGLVALVALKLGLAALGLVALGLVAAGLLAELLFVDGLAEDAAGVLEHPTRPSNKVTAAMPVAVVVVGFTVPAIVVRMIPSPV